MCVCEAAWTPEVIFSSDTQTRFLPGGGGYAVVWNRELFSE